MSQDKPSSTSYWHPMLAVAQARALEFTRKPEAVFWVYVFPLIMMLVLGFAFRRPSTVRFEVDVVENYWDNSYLESLQRQPDLTVNVLPAEECRRRLRTGKSLLAVAVCSGKLSQPPIEYWFDPTHPQAQSLRREIDYRLQCELGKLDLWPTLDVKIQESGGRYIDFLLPGLIGMGLAGGGLWGVGFAIVDLRIRKLLKRFVATPMRRSDFLGGVMISRMLFMVPEILLMLLFSWLLFGVKVHGNWLLLIGIVLLGAVQFSGIGLLVASRCKTLESASGLMNLVMLPMWTLCGIFFSWEKFPEAVHPIIRCLPLTPLIDSLRAVVNDGAGLSVIWPQLLIMLVWSVASFAIALKIFRWKDA